ncbi:MAG: dihydropteroate synthase [Chloroflexi bacterium]|nr:dihydropteroate synthase [Chloroflexota bacterium]
MNTKVTSAAREVIIGHDRATVLIGERINPTGKKKLEAALLAGDMTIVQKEALAQVQAGADILDVNVGATGVDEAVLLPVAVQVVMEAVDVPLCLDSHNPKALEAALKVYRGKPIVNSVNGQETSLQEILPLVKEYSTAVIGLTMDDHGIPSDADRRVAIAHKILERAEALGIPREDVIMDCLALTVGANSKAGLVTLEAVSRVKAELGVNQTLGASNVSYGLPNREVLGGTFLALAISAGITCPTVDVAKVRSIVVSTDLILGRDNYAQRYIKIYRAAQAAAAT